MRLLRRNTTKFLYYPYIEKDTDVNFDGEHTGEFNPGYGQAEKYRGNISIPSGYATLEMFGKDIRYTHILVMDNPNVPIDVNGYIEWKGEKYDIRAVRPSLNALSVALQRRTKNTCVPTRK